MSNYLFRYLQLFSYLGRGTPEDPGGDFEMCCWIKAPDEESALAWGQVLLQDYYRKRFSRSADPIPEGATVPIKGDILSNREELQHYANCIIPGTQLNEIPDWKAPWKNSNVEYPKD
ncbi:MAG: hypothetical protein R3C11_06580 [Planctomycetaceae bacterium]